MGLIQHIPSTLSLESPWMAAIVFGALAWFPFRTLTLKIRRWRRKGMDRSIIRGGRFLTDEVVDWNPSEPLPMQSTIQYLLSLMSWKRKVSFEEHSNGTPLSKRDFNDQQKAPKDENEHAHVQNPSPLIPTRCSDAHCPNPTIKLELTSSYTKEHPTPLPKQLGNQDLTRKSPCQGAVSETTLASNNGYDLGNHLRVTIPLHLQHSGDIRRSPLDDTMKGEQTLDIPSYRPQPFPHNPSEQLQIKERSFFHKPLDPYFFDNYTRGTVVFKAKQDLVHVMDSQRIRKRKFNLVSNDNPRKRPSLERSQRARSVRVKVMDPVKRKAREEELLLEFNRKRPKNEVNKSDRTVNNVSNPFADSKSTFETGVNASQRNPGPAFQFGAASVSSDDPKSEVKPAFRFGGDSVESATFQFGTTSAVPANLSSTNTSSDQKPPFQFATGTGIASSLLNDQKIGNESHVQSGTAAAESSEIKSDLPSVFQCGKAFADGSSSSQGNKSAAQAAFQFGSGATSTSSSLSTSNGDAVKAALQSGAGITSSSTTSNGDAIKPATQFGAGVTSSSSSSNGDAATPAFQFGAEINSSSTNSNGDAIKPAFQFGAGVTSSSTTCNSDAIKPAFQFGAGVTSSSTTSNGDAIKPAIYIGFESGQSQGDGAASGVAVPGSSTTAALGHQPAFTFGASAIPAAEATPTLASFPTTTPALSFGSSTAEQSAGAPLARFTFGGAPAAPAIFNTAAPFGATSNPIHSGAPAGAISRGGALRRRAGRTIRGRSTRRGAA